MRVITLYKTKINGRTTVSPVKPEGDYTTSYRVIAEEGLEITNGTVVCECIDTDAPSDWRDYGSMDNTQAKAEAYDILMGGAS